MGSFLISHDIKRKQHQQIFLKNTFRCIISHFYSWYAVHLLSPIRKNHIRFQKIRRIPRTSQKQHAGSRELYLIPSSLLCRIFNSNRKVILYHTHCHCRIIRTLTFNMIHLLPDQKTGIRDDLPVRLLVLIAKLRDLYIFRIGCMKHFIDQWYNQPRYLVN